MNRFSFYALVIFFFSLPWQDIVALPGGSFLSVSRIVGLILIVAGLGATLRRGTLRLRVPAATLVLTVLFAFWAVCGSLWSSGSSNRGRAGCCHLCTARGDGAPYLAALPKPPRPPPFAPGVCFGCVHCRRTDSRAVYYEPLRPELDAEYGALHRVGRQS